MQTQPKNDRIWPGNMKPNGDRLVGVVGGKKVDFWNAVGVTVVQACLVG